VVILTHAAGFGSPFSSWGGACSGNGDCVVTMDDVKRLTSSFDKGHFIDLLIIYK